MDDLRTTYLMKLEKMMSVEEQIIEGLPTMIDMATDEGLKAGLTAHLEETKMQRDRLTKLFAAHGYEPKGMEDKPFKMMMEEASQELEMITNPNVKDAVIIAASQTVEHLEMARYGTLVEWAKALEDDDGEKLLKETLGEEEHADKLLSGVAKGNLLKDSVNEKAAEA